MGKKYNIKIEAQLASEFIKQFLKIYTILTTIHSPFFFLIKIIKYNKLLKSNILAPHGTRNLILGLTGIKKIKELKI